ncbi:saccharopine dehydrogenase family protein [Roseitranquillus sediminis]|uniref:saccharopine dehydrogenase family protein n=1 Tax=Roseitranquillus sediminis TaxID=2809051 RepID=UPI001D0CB659|nr:saccharopine dehydrogenase NADP-binding domain-containing protein [Roseitranquillus sediminis]MBM9593585.1 saccharopine dehydrogenase NADP-binding domain-containing protein [Roseitranquillus sediminis]
MSTLLIYGATGYTGRLVAEEAALQGLRVVLAARNQRELERLAHELGLSWRSFALDEPGRLRAGLEGIGTVLNLAGPFSATAAPLIDVCRDARANYVDVTGEAAVLEAAAARDAEARRDGIVLLPGAGFDVVPSDCLTKHLKNRMPGMQRLRLSISGLNRASRGTTLTAIEAIGRGTLVRREGQLVELPRPPRAEADFGDGPRPTVAVSWGDVATAWYTTAAPWIEVHFEASPALSALARAPAPIGAMLRSRPLKAVLKALARRAAAGPDAQSRAKGEARLLGEAWDESGRRIASLMRTPDPYALTALTALAVAARVAEGAVPPGFHTPGAAFGADFVLGFDGVTRRDIA